MSYGRIILGQKDRASSNILPPVANPMQSHQASFIIESSKPSNENLPPIIKTKLSSCLLVSRKPSEVNNLVPIKAAQGRGIKEKANYQDLSCLNVPQYHVPQ
jgi:hypothetical protein